MTDISFQGVTNFCISPTAYQKVEESARKAYTNVHKECDCMLSHHRMCSLTTNPEHLTVIVKNGNNGFFKYVPFKENIENVLDEISRRVEELRKTAGEEPLTAWIVGGTSIYKPNNKIVDTLNKIAERICDRPDIDTSILVGSSTGEEKFIIRPGVKQLKLALDKRINPNNNLESELENIFDVF